MDVQKLPNVPRLHFLAVCDLPEIKKFRKKVQKNWICFQFLSHAGTVEEIT